MIALVLLRAMSEHDAFPWWQSDPFMFSPPVIGLTPTKALVLNMGVLLSCLLAFTGFLKAGTQLGKLRSILFALGSVGIVIHGLTTHESIFEGSNLLAIMSVLYLSSFAHCVPNLQQLISGITLGFVLVIIIVGANEVFVVHPETVSNYKINRDSFLMARGWAPDSFQALAYERRLYQLEPIAWFGLTNVYASFAAAGAAGWFFYSLKSRPQNRLWGIGIVCSIACLLGLLLSGAKGGMGALVLGGVFTAFAISVPRFKVNGQMLSILCGFVLLGIFGRGLIGEQINELSLLFRSQYMTGSMSMFIEHPLLGVGPGAFQDHYSIVKPDMSPEDVASAHSLPFDLIATLGLPGLAFIAFCVLTVSKIRPLLSPVEFVEFQITKRQSTHFMMLIIASAVVVMLRMNAPAMDQELLLLHVFAWLVWSISAFLFARNNSTGSSIRWATFAAAAVLAIHSMIEVTAIWMVSGMLCALMIGNACTQSGSVHTESTTTDPTADEASSYRFTNIAPAFLPSIALITSIVMVAFQLPNIARWEAALNRAADPAVQVSQIKLRLNALEYTTFPGPEIEEIASSLSLLTEAHVPSSIDRIVESLNQSEIAGRAYAIDQLHIAQIHRPSHTPTVIAASQQMLYLASAARAIGDLETSEFRWDQAVDLLENHAPLASGAGAHHWLGNVLWNRALEFESDDRRIDWLAEADRVWRIAFERSPHNPHQALRLMELARSRNQPSEMLQWAQLAMDLHHEARLDPLRGLSTEELTGVQQILDDQSK